MSRQQDMKRTNGIATGQTMPQDKITIREAAQLWNTTEDTLRHQIRRGTLAAVKEHGRWFILQSQDKRDNFQDKQRDETGQPQDERDSPSSAVLEARITHLEETITLLKEELASWKQTAQQAQQALLNQQTLALPDRMKDVKALPDDTQKRSFWDRLFKR